MVCSEGYNDYLSHVRSHQQWDILGGYPMVLQEGYIKKVKTIVLDSQEGVRTTVLVSQEGDISLPGRNPGTSSNVIRGMLKASQNLTNLAPLMEEVISKQPN